jgi:serine/threonine-protein kinase
MSILKEGEVIRDTYEVERLLGEGAFAEVYRVRHRFMGRQAMKVFKNAGATQKETEENIAEAILLSRIKHPNVVEVFDANVLKAKAGTFGYFTMTYVAGGTLERYWRSFGADFIPVADVVQMAKQICRGLSVAHSSSPPIVHRDIKPQNILVGFSGDGLQIRLSDFGLAKAVNPLTLLVSAKGTLGFKPPESLENQDSRASDIWAIGTTLYLLLTDQMPYPLLGDRDVGEATRFLRPVRPPSIYNIAVDAGLEAILFRCIASDPKDRYPHAMELLQDLERWNPQSLPAIDMSRSSFSAKSSAIAPSAADSQGDAGHMASEALQAAVNPAKLAFAADLMEEAMSKDPIIRERYEWQLRLWRKGVMHVSTASFDNKKASKSTKPTRGST